MFCAKNESIPCVNCSNTGNAAMTVSAIVRSGTSARSEVYASEPASPKQPSPTNRRPTWFA